MVNCCKNNKQENRTGVKMTLGPGKETDFGVEQNDV